MTACPSTTRTALVRTGALAVVFSTTFGLVLGQSGLALAQDSAPSTVRAVLGNDGSVSSVDRLGSEQAAPAAADLPVSLKIAETANGPVTTTNYTVENTTVKKQKLTYVGADGKEATTEQDVALPLVAQLSVRLPASRTDVSAFGARVTRLADGSTELVWSLVLFGPIGSPISEVGFTSSGSGAPVARLDVAAVQPNATPGLAATGQAANATLNGNGILNTVATGANDGLIKLSDGVAQLLAGLDKLHAGAEKLNAGIVTAVDGAEQLADGSEKAHAGSGDLAAGLGKLAAGNSSLAEGAGKLDTGAGKIVAGLDTANTGGVRLAEGGTALAKGAGDAAAGAKALSDGLAQISGGLDKISAAQGLPAALDGAKRLQAGVDQLRAGLGAAATEGTILNGVAKLSGGLAQVKGGLDALGTGLPAAQGGAYALADGVGKARGGVDQVIAGISDGLRPGGGIDQLAGTLATIKNSVPDSGAMTDAYLTGVINAIQAVSETDTTIDPATGATVPLVSLREKNMLAAGGLGQVSAGLGGAVDGAMAIGNGLTAAVEGVKKLQLGVGQLQAGTGALTDGLNKVAGGLESGDPTKPGVAEGLDALVSGLTAAVGGVTQLATGAKSAATGSAALAEGNAKIAAGATQLAAGNTSLSSGLGQLFTGSQELKAGTAKLSDGGGQLAAGATKAAQGADDLNAGLGKIAAGQRKVADGLPAAADGSGQLADGVGQVVAGQQKVAGGLSDVRSKAISVLQSQFKQGTELATQQLAALDAASARIAETPGAATTTWVLTQPDGTISAELASSDSDLARNTALGVGGALLLMTGIAGGYLSGRRKSVV